MTETLKRIITIDDDENIRRTIKKILEREGYSVDEAADATEGWGKVSTGGYDLVLLDIMMSGTTPNEFIQYLQGMTGIEPEFKDTRVLFVSAIPLPYSEKKKLTDNRQVMGYLEKPFTKEELLAKVEEALTAGEDGMKPMRKKPKSSVEQRELEPGLMYLIEEDQPEQGMKLFLQEKEGGRNGLCITRSNPEQVRREHNIGDARICWLTGVRTSEDTTSLSGLQELSMTINNFIDDNNKSVILLDGLEYLTTNNEFQRVLRLIQHLKDRVSTSDTVMLLPVNPETVGKRDLALLERECKLL